MITAEDLPLGLKGYVGSINYILNFMPDWISQHDFDDEFSGIHLPVFDIISGDDYILNLNPPTLHLLIFMKDEKLIKVKKVDGVIYYKSSKPNGVRLDKINTMVDVEDKNMEIICAFCNKKAGGTANQFNVSSGDYIRCGCCNKKFRLNIAN